MERALTTISHSDMPGRVGRNPLDTESKTITTTVRLTHAVRERILALVGEKGMARLIREAIEAELDRREQAGDKE